MWDALVNQNILLENGIITDKRVIGQNCFVIYVYENVINGKKYVGKTNNLKGRHSKHFSVAKRAKNGEYMVFHKAITKYGANNFSLKIVDIAFNEDDAYLKEDSWISELKTKDKEFGYNLCDGGRHTNSGRIVSQETRDKISAIHKGKIVSKETKQKISIAKTGTILSDETKLKMSLTKIGKIQTEETKQKIRDFQLENSSQRGKPRTSEVKEKISKGLQGSSNPASTINEEIVKTVRQLYSTGNYSCKNISDELNISIHVVKGIISKKTWKHVL